jgi:peptide/nickel transport system permease protein
VSAIASPAPPPRDTAARWVHRCLEFPRKSPKATIGVAILLGFVVMAIVGPLVAPHDPSATSVTGLKPPSLDHLLGTTQKGEDVLSQLLVGTGPSLEIGFLAAAFATILSMLVGIPSGYLAGTAGEMLSSFANVFLVIPALPLIIVIVAYLPSHGNFVTTMVIAVTGWAWGARVLRAQTLSLRNRDHIVAARALGEPTWRIMFVEMMPSLLPVILSEFLFTTVFAIVTMAGLAFLGLTDISVWNWGTMLYWAQNAQAFTLGAWWWYVPPGLCIALLGMALGLINFGIDELINPRLRNQRPTGRAARRETPLKSPTSQASAHPAAPAPFAPTGQTPRR